MLRNVNNIMAFLIDDEQLNFIEDSNIVYSVFLPDKKNVYVMWYNKKEDLFYFMVRIVHGGGEEKNCIAFDAKRWFKLKSHFEINSQTVVESFIVQNIDKK